MVVSASNHHKCPIGQIITWPVSESLLTSAMNWSMGEELRCLGILLLHTIHPWLLLMMLANISRNNGWCGVMDSWDSSGGAKLNNIEPSFTSAGLSLLWTTVAGCFLYSTSVINKSLPLLLLNSPSIDDQHHFPIEEDSFPRIPRWWLVYELRRLWGHNRTCDDAASSCVDTVTTTTEDNRLWTQEGHIKA